MLVTPCVVPVVLVPLVPVPPLLVPGLPPLELVTTGATQMLFKQKRPEQQSPLPAQ